jgi:predicted Zn-dependent protease
MRLLTTFFVLAIAITASAQSDKAFRAGMDSTEAVCKGNVIAYFDSNDVPSRPRGRLGQPLENESIPTAFPESTEHLMQEYQSVPRGRVIIALVINDTINAWTIRATSPQTASIVCISQGIANFIYDEDELAFVIAHELGHVLDSNCIGHQPNREVQIFCEQTADGIGFELMREAGYAPVAAAGAFGRLELYLGDTQTGIVGWLNQLQMDHPITPKRIESLRRLVLAAQSH